MLSYSDKFKEIKIRYVLLIFILVYAIIIIASFFDIWINEELAYIAVVAYILYKLKDYFKKLKYDVSHILENVSLKTIFSVLVFNIVFSIAMIYICDYLVSYFPILNNLILSDDYTSSVFLDAIVLFLSVVIVAPISEELIFRGVILNRLSTRMSLTLAILLSSFIFGLMHGFGSIICAFIFGLCMCALYLKTDNIFVPMLVHFLNNLTSMLFEYIPNIDAFFSNDIVVIAFIILGAVSLVCILIFLKNELNW